MSYFASEYTIHFDDTMAYGSHHFLTGFKFQCAVREAFLFGERVFDLPGVPECLEKVHLFTGDAYSRNLSPSILGDRVAILLTLEDWGRISARFCYRVVGEQGTPICAGFQTLICADAETGQPILIPPPLRDAMDSMREIEEPLAEKSFRDLVLAGGDSVGALFSPVVIETARNYLKDRYPVPGVISKAQPSDGLRNGFAAIAQTADSDTVEEKDDGFETLVFSGQGSFDPRMLSERINQFSADVAAGRIQLDQSATIAERLIGGDATGLVSGVVERCAGAVRKTPELMQVAIHLQNVIGAWIHETAGNEAELLMGHSFGEIAALEVAGCFDLPTGVEIVCQRVRTVADHAPCDGELLVVAAPRQAVSSEAAVLGLGQVAIAGRNHDEQTVATGPATELSQLGDYFRSVNVDVIKIPSPTSFHHPCLRSASAAWLAELRKLSIGAPQRAVYSPIGRRYVSSADDVAAILASSFLRSFDLQGAIQDVVAAGGGRFVDCGSSGSLGRLLVKAAGAADIEVTNVDADIESVRVINAGATASATAYLPMRESSAAPHTDAFESVTSEQNLVPTIAVLGQGCLLPGGATSPEQLQAAIGEQRLGIVDQSKTDPHWLEDFYSAELVPDRSTSPLMGKVNEEDIVVPEGVDAAVFESFTRTQKLLCIALAPCVASIKNAKRVLCFVGATADGFEDQDEVSSLRYAGIDPVDGEVDGYLNSAASAFAEPHDAIQEVFDRIVRPGLKVTLVDAACASSLYAVSLGMHALESYETDAVIAGGVFCPGPGNSCLFSQFRGTTSTGCRPFDVGADGVVFSEGSAFVVLRRLADAETAGDSVSAIVRGIGLSSDGKSSSANVPQTRGQILALERCYANYGIESSTVQAIEAHGTSTPVGDSTEIDTLHEFFADSSQGRSPIPVHSLKGLLGHAGWAAGTASLIAACQYLRSGLFPGQAFFQDPSAAVENARETLQVSATPTYLPRGQRRIAVDGFGFGGANAHVVMDSYTPGKTPTMLSATNRSPANQRGAEAVVVAVHQIEPTLPSPSGMRFDRENVMVEGHLVLPDLADDMDISQTLAVTLVDQTIAMLPMFDDELRKQTSVVLAQSGKTERGVEATMRVLAPRFRRHLSGSRHVASLDSTVKQARPSGAYTLQCMMPNVSSGRAALLMNLNGPNFVVDAGKDSLAAAMDSASFLLQSGDESGTKLVVVAAINANPWRAPATATEAPRAEFASAFAVTTRRYAELKGFDIISPATEMVSNGQEQRPAVEQVSRVAAPANDPVDPSDVRAEVESEFPVHVPVWVESQLELGTESEMRSARLLAIVRADEQKVNGLLSNLGSVADDSLIAVVGPGADEVCSRLNHSSLLPVALESEQSIAERLDQVSEFDPQVVLACDTISTWDLVSTLDSVATHNELGEFLFLVAQRFADKLKQGSLELWGLYLGAWDGALHPATGSVIGQLKAIDREIEQARVGVVSTRTRDLRTGLRHWCAERAALRHENEVAFDNDVRWVRRLRVAPDAASGKAQVELGPDSVVVATGGARGVTAVLADALLRDYRCTVIALGRSPLESGPMNPDSPEVESAYYERFLQENPGSAPPEMKRSFESARARWEASRTIQELGNLGGEVHYIQADVTNPAQVSEVVAEIASKFGRVDLLIHGAGVQYSKRLEDRTLSEFRRTYQVKVVGLNILVSAMRRQFGKTVAVHALTSAYSVFGNDGQHDYGAANETLDRLCGLTEEHAVENWMSVAWLAWDGIGMTRGSEYRALAQQRGLSGLMVESGQRVFRAAFEGRTQAAINVPVSAAEHLNYGVVTVPPATTSTKKSRIRELAIRVSDEPCLPFHVVGGSETLPGAWTLERMVRAALPLADAASEVVAASLENVTFRRFVRCTNHHDPNFRVIAEATDQGVRLNLLGDLLHPSGEALSRDVVFASARLSFLNQSKMASTLKGIGSSVCRDDRGKLLDDPYCDGNQLDLSGPFDCIRQIEIGDQGRRACFEPSTSCDWPGVVPALLIDAALRIGCMYPNRERDVLCVPVRIGRIVVPLGMSSDASSAARWRLQASNPIVDGQDIAWDTTEVLDESGALRLLVENSMARKI